jgi:hypothetical protein
MSTQPEGMKRIEGFEMEYSTMEELEAAAKLIAGAAGKPGLRVTISATGAKTRHDPLGQRRLVTCTWSY